MQRFETTMSGIERALEFLACKCDSEFDLVNVAWDSGVQNEGDKQLLHITLWDVQFLGDEWYPDPGVGLYELQHHLCANILQQVLNVLPDEGIVINCLPARKAIAWSSACQFYRQEVLCLDNEPKLSIRSWNWDCGFLCSPDRVSEVAAMAMQSLY